MNSHLSSTDQAGRADRLTLELDLGPPADTSAAEARFVRELLSLAPGGHLLDAPCGNGRHSSEFAKAGISVTAVDADLMAVALAKTALHGLPAKVIALDLFADEPLVEATAFDAAVSLYSCIGYSCDIDSDRRFLARLRAALQPGSPLVIGTANRPAIFALGETHTHFSHDDVTIFRHDIPHQGSGLLERRFNVSSETISSAGGASLHTDHIHCFTEWRRIYDVAGISALLNDAGFTLDAIHAGFSTAPGDPDRDAHLLYRARAT